MAVVDPRLPRPMEDRNKAYDGDWSRLLRRLDELFKDLLSSPDVQIGTITINNLSTTATATLPRAARYVCSQGFTYAGVDAPSSVASLSLGSDGKTITATRVGNITKLNCYYIAVG